MSEDPLEGCFIACDECEDRGFFLGCDLCLRASMLAYGRKVAEECAEIAINNARGPSGWVATHIAREIRNRYGARKP